MKKLLLLILLIGQSVFAQQIEIISTELVKGTESGGFYFASFSPKGTYLLVSSANYTGLKQIMLETKEVKILTQEPGAGYDAKISADESTILFKKTEFTNNLRYTSLYQYSFTDNKTVKVENAVREKLTPVFAQNKPAFVKGKALIKNANVTASEVMPFINIEDRQMALYKGSTKKIITPNGENESYFWASVSPDGKHIVYTTATKGTFVCSIDGSNAVSLGKLNAPVWLNNQWIVGMDDKDDGTVILSSSIVASTMDGKIRQALPAPSIKIAMYPAASPDGKQIAFNTEKGEIYLMNINLK
jgi:Tol biopolymer transport system component